ncbi:MAG: DUF2380 domain-containing protein [Alphaproteobacteria bacterium]|nr:DUF2380 domain-containing protein [Alphaproteobacteria bacterium]
MQLGIMDRLSELNPSHEMLRPALRRRNSAPSAEEIFSLRDAVEEEMRHAGERQGFPRLELHHHLPRQYWSRLPQEVDPNSAEYTAWILRELHRLKPQGMHSGSDNWNKVWGDYLAKDYAKTKRTMDKQLDTMIRDYLERITGKRPAEE